MNDEVAWLDQQETDRLEDEAIARYRAARLPLRDIGRIRRAEDGEDGG